MKGKNKMRKTFNELVWKNKKAILAFLLALVCALPCLALAGCAQGEDNKTSGGKVEKPGLEHLNGLDFDGTDVNFMIAGADGDSYHLRSIYVDEDGSDVGDSVDSAVFKRNMAIQEKLNVNIVAAYDQDGKVNTWGKTILLSGSDEVDIVAGLQYGDVQLALDGVVLDLNTLSEHGADYIKWNEEYWATSYIEALSFGDKNYWLTGDLCLRFTGGYYSFFVNSRIYDDVLKSKYGSIYDVVNDKKWTYDMLLEMTKACAKDTNGDDTVDAEGEDVLGLALPVHDNTNGMAVGAGVMWTQYDENRTPSNIFTNRNTTLMNYIEKLYEVCNTAGVHNFGGDYQGAMQLFASGQAAFVSGRLNQAELYLSEMEDNYYVIPCPMLTDGQGTYYSSVHDAINVYGINVSSMNIPAAAATLEYMAYESYYTIRPIYYDSFLKFKYTRDDEAAGMIDLMHDTVYTDFVYIWQFSADLSGMGSFLRNYATNKRATSVLKGKQDAWTQGLEAILLKIQDL